jgi:pSer/pThr/pTyr-binding forkhead associated (FHA) protein
MAAMPSAHLVISRTGEPERTHPLVAGDTLIGRSSSCDISIPDQGLSREHAVVLAEDGEFTIEDLQSSNGTHVNRKTVRSAVLQDGDLIELGHTELRFRIDR